MEERGNKPIMCSVLFMDIMEYSRKPVSGQIALKEGFNAILSSAIRDVPADDRIILDTGDGAAICFLGDADIALKVALLLREGLVSEVAHTDPPLLVRLGINFGPVRLVKNLNERPNIVGDGINVAQRVMGFAKPGQILVSRSYYDAVSRLTQEYAGMFQHEGSRTDRHVREHELYAIGSSEEFTVTQHGLVHGAVPRAAGKADAVNHASSQLRALYVGVLAVLLIFALFKVVNRPAEQSIPVQAPPVAEVPAQLAVSQTAAVDAIVPLKMAEPVAEQKPEALHPHVVGTEQVVRPAQEASKIVPPGQKKIPASPEATKENGTQQAPGLIPGEIISAEHAAMASVSLAVMPWGEVYLDGRMRGVSPPLVELQVAPGKHKIEIRNMTFPAYTQSIQIKAGEKIKIKHKFAN